MNEVWHARSGIVAWVRAWSNPGTWQRLEALPDPRSPQGRIYPLAAVLESVTNQVTSAPGTGRPAATQPDITIPPTCGNRT